jgi:uncharacterized damage-inducible protein DinB
MLIETLKMLFERDLKKLKLEIELYQNEEQLWATKNGISNSAGNLCLHLIGNLNCYIGATLGKTNYIRNRPLEFSLKAIPISELLAQIDETIVVVNQSLSNITEQELQSEYPILVFETKTSVTYLLVHLTTHLAYHLGQINYHRRLIDLESN